MAIETGDLEWVETNVLSVEEALDDIDFAVVADMSGKVISQTNAPTEFVTKLPLESIQKKWQEGKDIYTGLYNSESAGLAMISVSKILNDEGQGQPAGILIMGSNFNQANLDNINKTAESDVALYTDTEDQKIFTSLKAGGKVKIEKEQQQAVMQYRSYSILNDVNNKATILLQVTSQSEAGINTAKTLRNYTLGFIMVALLAIVILYIWQRRRQIDPLLKMIAAIKVFAQGNFKEQIDINTNINEFTDLANSLNNMSNGLRQLITGIVDNAQILAGQSQTMAATTAEVSTVAEEIYTASHQMSVSASEEAEQAVTAADKASAVKGMALEEKQQLFNTVEKMNLLKTAVTETGESIHKLSSHSKNINQIVEVTTVIAEQTNLLALNASIEAARAGEYGRGFAVVAEEVRKLAEQSAAASKEIKQLIAEVTAETAVAVQSMAVGSKEVETGVAMVFTTNQSVDKIIGEVVSIVDMANRVATGAEQSGQGIKNIVSGNEQITASMQQITATATELAAVSDKLQALVNKFEV
jgi:methyl-accepting chemotaxis protein